METIAFGVGIDISNIRSVVCYYAPENLSVLMQLFGRGGRDGSPCKCYLFYPTQGYISSELQTFIKGQQCFRTQFLNYFDGEETHEENFSTLMVQISFHHNSLNLLL